MKLYYCSNLNIYTIYFLFFKNITTHDGEGTRKTLLPPSPFLQEKHLEEGVTRSLRIVNDYKLTIPAKLRIIQPLLTYEQW